MGAIRFDSAMPDGAPRKLMDSQRLKNLGWQSRVDLYEGLTMAYQDFLSTI
jgi:GDP-L-fucose synthase